MLEVHNSRNIITMKTSPRYNVKGHPPEAVSSPTFEIEVHKRMALVDWINSIVPHFSLSLKASDEEIRESLLDNNILPQILHKLKFTSVEEVDVSSLSPEIKRKRIQQFITVMSEHGLPTFKISDLEKGSMKPILDCLLALKEQSKKALPDLRPQRANSQLSPESPTKFIKGGNKLHDVYQLKRGFSMDISSPKIFEMLKLNNLDNAPTHSLLSVMNGILDESIDKKNAEMPQSVACLLRKVVQEIERRIATQAEHLRTQSNLFKAREEKYQSRIKVLEVLARASNEENKIINKHQHTKLEKSKVEMKEKHEQQDSNKLRNQNDENNVEVSTLKQNLKMAEKMHEQHNMDLGTQATTVYSKFEESLQEHEKLLEDGKVRTEGIYDVLTLKQELEVAKNAHELRSLELQNEAQMIKSDLEERLRQHEQLLEDSKLKIKELEVNSKNESQSWIRRERIYESCVNIQWSGLKELWHCSEAIKQEMLKTQKVYFEELNHVGTELKKLAKAAQSYHGVVNENRKLYNELQDLKGSIRVYCRIRPFRPCENQKQTIIENIGEHGDLTVINPAKPKEAQKSFRFNKVYGPMATQAEVFSDTQPLIRTILDGYNVCIFAYGQTGSGKTYTMSGPANAAKEDWGVNYRALDDLFQITEDRKRFFSYDIGVQIIEIYNEQIRDLLSADGSQKKLGILATPQLHGLAVPDASMLPVQSTEDVIELMNTGLSNRSIGATAMNERSSRSHSVVTIHVQATELKSGTISHGSLHLVDLAGSERVDRSEVTGDRLKESQHINKSLSALGDVIFSLAQKNPHVPYRNSKLTQVLQASLGGRAKTLMFVQVNPDVDSYTESLSALKFAQRVSGVELGAARSSKEGKDVKELIDQIAYLKDLIAKKDEELDRLQIDSRTPNSRRSLSYLKGGSSSPSAKSLGNSPQRSPTISIRRAGSRHKSASEEDNLSKFADLNMQAIFEHDNEGMQSSRSMSDLIGSRDSGSDEVSDSDLSVGTEIDSTSETSSSHEPTSPSNSAKSPIEKPRTPKRASQPSRLSAGASRMAPIKTTLKTTSALKKSDGKNASPGTQASARRA